MPGTGSPRVEVEDVRAWEAKLTVEQVFYHYTLAARPGAPVMAARTALVWIPAPGVQFVLAHDGEALGRGRIEHVSGAWIRAAARLHTQHDDEAVRELIRMARWNLDSKLPAIRG